MTSQQKDCAWRVGSGSFLRLGGCDQPSSPPAEYRTLKRPQASSTGGADAQHVTVLGGRRRRHGRKGAGSEGIGGHPFGNMEKDIDHGMHGE